ncbi:MAG TPA: hypothetical protein EYQ63_24475, partial [Fuerstia sp.]|nr:hypothetical protein [Fuerstiella sp.]
MIYRLIILFVVAMVFSVPAMAQKKKLPAVSQDVLDVYEAHSFEGVSYRLMKPIDLGNNADKAYPLILSLHGAGGKGKDNIRNLRNWNGYLADEQLRRKHPCFVVAPQSAGSWRVQGSGDHLSEDHIKGLSPAWRKLVARKRKGKAQPTAGNLGKVFKLLDSLTEEFNIDPDRIYVLGHSMGGFGTWTALGEAPSRFAAA